MTKQKGLKAIIISLLIVLSTTCFSLLFTNAYTSFSKEEPQAASTWNFDSGGFGNGNFWDVLKEVFAGITYKDTVTYNSYTNFEISSEKGFIAFAGSVSEGYDFAGKTVTLTTDLDFSGDAFLPVGAKINTSNGNISSYEDTTNSFCGTFDGGSHTISNITLNSTWKSSSAFEGSTAIGVFCMVGASSANVSSWSSSASYNCVIKNLHVNNMSVTESNVATSIGAIAGAMGTMNYGYNSNTVTIQNCAVTNFNVSLYNNTSMSCVGGLVGISRVYNPSSCTAPVIKDCLVYSMNVTNQTRTCNEVSALTPAHGVYYSGVYLYYCPFYTITRCVNYEDSVDSASLYFYPDSDGDFSYHMSTLENYYGSSNISSSCIEKLTGIYSVSANDMDGEDTGDQISTALYYFDNGSFCNYSSSSYDILGGPERLTSSGAWFVACYYDVEYGGWIDSYPSVKVYLKDYLTEVTFTTSGSGSNLITTSALVPKGVIATESNKILNIDMFYTDSTTNIENFDIFAQNKTVDGSSVLRWEIDNDNYTYTAVFQETQYTVTFAENSYAGIPSKTTVNVTLSQSPKVTVTYSSTSCSFYLNTNKQTYTYEPISGYKLTGYKVGGITYTTASKTVTISGNTTFAVIAENIQYTLTFPTVTPYTTRSGNQTYTVNHGTTIAVSQTATTCSYTFNSTTVTYSVTNGDLYRITSANLTNNFPVTENTTIKPSAEQYAIYVKFNNSTGDYTNATPSRTDQFTIAYNENANPHYTITNTMPDNGIDNKTLTYTLNGIIKVTYIVPALYILSDAGKSPTDTLITITPVLEETYAIVTFEHNDDTDQNEDIVEKLLKGSSVGINYSSTCTFTYTSYTNSTSGESKSITYAPNAGLHLLGYKINNSLNTKTPNSYTVNEETTFNVDAQINSYTITFKDAEYTKKYDKFGTEITTENPSYTVTHGTELSFNNYNYTFENKSVEYRIIDSNIYRIVSSNIEENVVITSDLTVTVITKQYQIYVQFVASTGDYVSTPSRTDQFTIGYDEQADLHYTINNAMPDNGLNDKILTYTLNGSTQVTYTVPAIYVLKDAGISSTDTLITITPELEQAYVMLNFQVISSAYTTSGAIGAHSSKSVYSIRMDKSDTLEANKNGNIITFTFTKDGLKQNVTYNITTLQSKYYIYTNEKGNIFTENPETGTPRSVNVNINIKQYIITFG